MSAGPEGGVDEDGAGAVAVPASQRRGQQLHAPVEQHRYVPVIC